MPKGFPNDRMQNLPPPYVVGAASGGKGPPRGPVDWTGAYDATLDEFKIPTVSSGSPAEPMRGARILSPDLLTPGMGRPDGCAPNCTMAQEFGLPFSRVAFYVTALRTTEANISPPPQVDFEVYFSIGCTRTLVFSGLFAPQTLDTYGDLLVQVSGLLATEVSVFAKIDLGNPNNAGAKPYWMTLAVLIDRQNADRQTWRGPQVT